SLETLSGHLRLISAVPLTIHLVNTAKRFFRTPFGSALTGGIVVAIFFGLAVSAGWVKADSSAPSTEIAAPSPPIPDPGPGDSAPVKELYRRAGQGVAFISAEQAPHQEISPFGVPEEQGGGTATGSGFLIDNEGHIVTNAHVVEGADKIEVRLGASDKTYTA